MQIKKGQRVVMFYRSANFDEEVFDDPYTFNILRDPNPHVGFGGTGAHYCIGANLARMTIDLMFNAIADHMPDLTPSASPSGCGRAGSTASSTGRSTTPGQCPARVRRDRRRRIKEDSGGLQSGRRAAGRRRRRDVGAGPGQQLGRVGRRRRDALGVPERLGGDGVGLPEIATALTEIGRHGTTSPALATLGLGLVPLLDLASDEQQDRYLAGVAKGARADRGAQRAGHCAAGPARRRRFAGGKLVGHQGRCSAMRSKRIGSS